MADWFEPLPISSPKQGSKWSPELSVAPSKSIVKASSRQSCACDWCRYSKKRCDGGSPCMRCRKANRECIYTSPQGNKQKSSPQSSSPSTTPSPESSPVTGSLSLELSVPPTQHTPTLHLSPISPTESLAKNYLDLFFNRMYLMNRLLPNFSMRQFDQPTDRAVLLQLYSAAANASRAYGASAGSSLYWEFEKRAQQLARELFDDISPQTAFGFHLLSCHTRGRDIAKANYYRDITHSMCDQLLRSRNMTKEEREHILRIKLINYGVREFTDPGPPLDESHEQYATNKTSLQLLEVNRITSRFRVLFSQIVTENDANELVVRSLTPLQCQEGFQVVDRMREWFSESELIPPHSEDVITAHSFMIKSIIFFGGGQDKEAITILNDAMTVMEGKTNLLFTSNASIMECFHFCFLVAHAVGDVPLMQRIQALREHYSMVLPSTRRSFMQDARRLEEYTESQKEGPSPPPSLPTAFPSSWSETNLWADLPADLSSSAAHVPPPCPQSMLVPSPHAFVENYQSGEPPSPFSFLSSTLNDGQLGSDINFPSLSSSSDQIPFSLEDFIDSLGNETCNIKSKYL